MLSWIISNAGSIVITLLMVAVVVGIIIVMVKDRKKGKSCSCGGSCCHCPMAGSCHNAGAEKTHLSR